MSLRPQISSSLETETLPEKVMDGRLNFTIGLPKENSSLEKRIALTPDSVSVLVKNGLKVMVEKGAGLSSHFTDQAYADAGA